MVDSELMVEDAVSGTGADRVPAQRRACVVDAHTCACASYRRCLQPVKARPPATLGA